MKKLLSILLVLTLVLSLCACGNNNASGSLDYNNSFNQISNDTTVVTPDTTGSSAIKFELNSNANIDDSNESNEVVSNNEKIEAPISSEIKTVQ